MSGVSRVLLASTPSAMGVTVQHFFVARLLDLDETARTDPEFLGPSRGSYQFDRISLQANDLASVDLEPSMVQDYIVENREALSAELALAE